MKARSICATACLRLALCAACLTLVGIVAPGHASAQTTSPAYIGTAEMGSDGTIVLRLRAEDSKRGIVGHSVLAYPRDHPQYEAILRHVGPMKPGETRPVRPWPD
jgi:hypothetical protein